MISLTFRCFIKAALYLYVWQFDFERVFFYRDEIKKVIYPSFIKSKEQVWYFVKDHMWRSNRTGQKSKFIHGDHGQICSYLRRCSKLWSKITVFHGQLWSQDTAVHWHLSDFGNFNRFFRLIFEDLAIQRFSNFPSLFRRFRLEFCESVTDGVWMDWKLCLFGPQALGSKGVAWSRQQEAFWMSFLKIF